MILAAVTPMLLGILLTPLGLIPPILLLFGERPRQTAGAFLLAWLMGVFAGFFIAFSAAELLAVRTPGLFIHLLRIAGGLALILLAMRQWSQRKAAAEMPAWMRQIDGGTPAQAFRLGLLLSFVNPKVLLLSIAAGIATAGIVPEAPALLASLLFALAASIAVALPLLLHLLFGNRVLQPFGKARDWLIAHNSAVMAVVLLAIGIALLQKGVSGLIG